MSEISTPGENKTITILTTLTALFLVFTLVLVVLISAFELGLCFLVWLFLVVVFLTELRRIREWRRKMVIAAEKLGLSYQIEDREIPQRYRYLNMLQRLAASEFPAQNVLKGEYQGHHTIFFSSSVAGTYAIFDLIGKFPELRVWPVGDYDAGMRGGSLPAPEIDLDNLEFSRKYYVRCNPRSLLMMSYTRG